MSSSRGNYEKMNFKKRGNVEKQSKRFVSEYYIKLIEVRLKLNMDSRVTDRV